MITSTAGRRNPTGGGEWKKALSAARITRPEMRKTGKTQYPASRTHKLGGMYGLKAYTARATPAPVTPTSTVQVTTVSERGRPGATLSAVGRASGNVVSSARASTGRR